MILIKIYFSDFNVHYAFKMHFNRQQLILKHKSRKPNTTLSLHSQSLLVRNCPFLIYLQKIDKTANSFASMRLGATPVWWFESRLMVQCLNGIPILLTK